MVCMNDPEAAATEAAERGDKRAALTTLMDAYGAQIYRHCLSFLGDHAWAEDVQQVVFVQAFRDMDRFGGRSSWRTWLFAIARNRCLDAKKIRGRAQRRVEVRSTPPDRVDRTPSPEARVAADSTRQALSHCLEKLTPKVRSVVLLRYQDGLSFTEMGEATGERAGTLQARVARAMPTLRACLEAQGLEFQDG